MDSLRLADLRFDAMLNANEHEWLVSSNKLNKPQGSLRILLLRTTQIHLKYFRIYLEHLGHQMQTAETTRGAIAAADGSIFDVLISDIGLPDGDGWELPRRARFAQPVFAIAISGYGTAGDPENSIKAGYRHHVVKPIDLDRLDEVLDEAARECLG